MEDLELLTIKTKLQSDWKNCPVHKDLEADRLEAQGSQDVFKAKLLEWEEIRDGGPKIKVAKGKSSARPLTVRKFNEWKYSSLSEPLLNTVDMFDINPRTSEDVDSARNNKLILNYQWSTKVNKTKLVGDVTRTIVDEGTVIVKTGWDSQTGVKIVEREEPVFASPEESLMMMQQAVQAGEMSEEQAQARLEMGEPMQKGTQKVYVEEETLVVNQPTYEVCNNANVIIDPTCEGVIENANFVIHEYDTDYATLKKDEYVKDETGEYGVYHNIESLDVQSSEVYDEHESEAKATFKFSDKPRKKVRAFEYWGYWDIQGNGELVSIVATWIGTTMVRLEENPFPHGRIPFSVATYMPVKKEVHGEPDAELLKENQEAIGKMQRAMHDITAKQAVNQEFIDENLFASPSQKQAYERGNTVYTRGGLSAKNSIHRGTVDAVPSVVFESINYWTQDAENLTGTRPFSSSNISTATGVRTATDATSKRELDILRRISALYKDMARMTIAMNQAFLSEEEYVRITNEEFIMIRRDDLAGEFDLELEVSTPEKDDDKAQKLMTLLQTNQANMEIELQKIFYGQLLDLWKLPKASKVIKEFEPQVDEGAQQLQQLQIEGQRLANEKLKMDIHGEASKIAERDSRAVENSADVRVKDAKAELQLAQAAKLESETDLLDATYIDESSGAKREREIEDAEFKSLDASDKLFEQDAMNRASKIAEITQGLK